MRCLVTGAAGFIGSHLAERLVSDGHTVLGVDAFTDYYPTRLKEANLAGVMDRVGFELVRADIAETDLDRLVADADVVFHLAAQAGVRASWGRAFRRYSDWNVLGTQRLLEAAKDRGVDRFVYASSSAVYGRSDLPMREEDATHPLSPYGVSKLAAEHLCVLYATAYGMPTVSLRYFTVFGPRQRPDMAFHRFIRAIMSGRPIPVFGDGRQTRDFTFVGDIVDATARAGVAPTADVPAGAVLNVAGGSRVEVVEAIRELERVTGRTATLAAGAAPAGEMPHTYGDTSRAAAGLGWRPKTGLREGLAAEVAWVADVEAHGGFPDG